MSHSELVLVRELGNIVIVSSISEPGSVYMDSVETV